MSDTDVFKKILSDSNILLFANAACWKKLPENTSYLNQT